MIIINVIIVFFFTSVKDKNPNIIKLLRLSELKRKFRTIHTNYCKPQRPFILFIFIVTMFQLVTSYYYDLICYKYKYIYYMFYND